jgi:hypothetical protein
VVYKKGCGGLFAPNTGISRLLCIPGSGIREAKDRIRFFLTGFVADFYDLKKETPELMLENSSQAWRSGLFFLEIWGRIYCWHNFPDEVKEHVQKYVSCGDV